MNATKAITMTQIDYIVSILRSRGLIRNGLLVGGWGNRISMPRGTNQYHDEPYEVFVGVSSEDAGRWIAAHC